MYHNMHIPSYTYIYVYMILYNMYWGCVFQDPKFQGIWHCIHGEKNCFWGSLIAGKQYFSL